jgi:LacI family transcriptional regulator
VQGVVLAPPWANPPPCSTCCAPPICPSPWSPPGVRPADAINVRIDDRQASQAMAQHLLDLGHRRIGFIAGNPDQTASAERLEGARGAIAAVEGAELVLAQGAFTYGSGLRAAEALLDSDHAADRDLRQQ